MTQEDKSLLIKDLCAKLPYGVQVQDTRCGINGKLHDMLVFPLYKGNDVYDYIATTNFYTDCYYDDIAFFKPYLFPLSSMTKEQESYLHFNTKFRLDTCDDLTVKIDEDDNYFCTDTYDYISLIDWLNKNHFDYRGLIEKGLAIDATGLNIY